MNKTRMMITCFTMLLIACSSEQSMQTTTVDTGTTHQLMAEVATESEKPLQTAAPVKRPIEPTPATVVEQTQPSSAALPTHDQNSGLALAKKSGCLNCHSIEKKIVGPAWRDVAKRYKGQAGARALLIEKVKKGGGGNWTEVTGGTPMPPNSPRVANADIETLVDFVLSLE